MGRWWDRKRWNWWDIRDSILQFMEQSVASLSCFVLSTFFTLKEDAFSGKFVIMELPFTSTLGILRVMRNLVQRAFRFVQSLLPCAYSIVKVAWSGT